MPKLYQHELRNNLIALSGDTDCSQVDTLIKKIDACIKLNKKYFPEDYPKIFDEIIKEEPNFESFFSVTLNSASVKEKPLRIFLPAALYDICTDHKHDFIGQTGQRLVKIIRDSEERSKTCPETDDLHSKIAGYEISRIELESRATKSQANHTLNTGNWLIEFLKSNIEIERELQEAAANETKQQSSWTDIATRAISVSEIISEASKKKSVGFAASVAKGNSDNGKGPGIL